MAVNINLATGGVIGVTGLTAGLLPTGITMTPNTIYATANTAGNVVVNLPAPTQSDPGDAIIIKNFLPAGSTLTINRNGNLIERGTAPIEFDAPGETSSLYYINEAVGWMVGPSNF